MSTMRAYRGFEGEAEPRLVDITIPTVGDDDVLIKIESAGLTTGTFTLLRVGMLRPMPMTLGHEGAGVVTAIGRDVRGIAPGNRVRVHPTITCGRCRYCLSDHDHLCRGGAMMGFVSFGYPVEAYHRYHNGFMAEYVVAPQRQVDLLPDNVSFDVGAKLHYLGNANRVLKVARLRPASTLGILGATGSMAVATIKVAPFFGVERLVLIGRSTSRLEEVKALTNLPVDIVATDALEDDWAQTDGLGRRMAQIVPEGVDAMIDYLPAGGSMWQAIIGGLATGGTLVNMGGGMEPFSAPMRLMVAKCWGVAGTRNHSRLDALEALRLLGSGRLEIDELITHVRPLADVKDAIATLQSRHETVWMSVVHP